MTKSISKSRALTCFVEVNDFRIKQMKDAPNVASSAVEASAKNWHDKTLPEHFKKPASGRYKYAPRSKNYLKQKGTKPDLIHSNAMNRDLASGAAYQKTSQYGINLKMQARTLNLVPRMANGSQDFYVVHRGNRKYPNLKREITAITDPEREEAAEVAAKYMESAFGPDQSIWTKNWLKAFAATQAGTP